MTFAQPAASPGGRYVPELDGLRAFAILLVMFFHARGHAAPTSELGGLLFRVTEAGWMGVDLFFVLSGYLITGILLQTRDHRGYFRSFIARRALRILPLYYAVLAVVTLGVVAGKLDGEPQALPYFWGYLQNWLRLDGDSYRIKMLAHFWSLAIEEQFYLFWPLLIWFVPRRWTVGLCVAFVGIAVASRVALPSIVADGATVGYYLTPTRMDALAMGGLLAAIASSSGIPLRSHVVVGTILLSTAAIAVIVATTGHFRPQDPLTITWGLLATTLLFAAVVASIDSSPPAGRWRSLLRNPQLVWIGKISYGAYVFHWPVMVLTSKVWPRGLSYLPNQLLYWLVTFSLTLGLAATSFRWFETPFLRLKSRFTTQPPAG